jgi:ATP-dependent Zn protease
LFSSVHGILSAPLVNAALWATERGLPAGAELRVSLNEESQKLSISFNEAQQISLPVQLDIERIKRRASSDFRALLAVHEAGHGLAYARLFGHAPQEVKINVASFEGGYNSYVRLKAESRQNRLDRICVSLAGRAAEMLVFGEDACSTGSYGDIKQATESAAQFVRHYGFGCRLSHTDVTQSSEDNINTDIEPTNAMIETLLYEQMQRASNLVKTEVQALMQIVAELMSHGQVKPERMAQLLGVKVAKEDALLTPYAEQLSVFMLQQDLMERISRPADSSNLNSRVELAL